MQQPLFMEITLQNRGLLISEVFEFTITYRFPHISEKLQKEMNIVNGIKSHREDFPAHVYMT